MNAARQVVVTGLGVVAPNGIGIDAFWRSLCAGESGIAPVTLFDTSELSCRIAGEVRDFVPAKHMRADIKPNRISRCTQFGLCAAEEAIRDACLDAAYVRSIPGVPIVMGVSSNAMELAAKPPSPLSCVIGIPHATGSTIAYVHGIHACLTTLSDGCASSLDAVAAAAALIRGRRAEFAIAGGTDSSMSRLVFECFIKSRMFSTRNEAPQRASRPFDRDRDGGLLAEGAGIVILESREHAAARGARPYAELLGFASFADPPDSVEGAGLSLAMSMALANSRIAPDQVDCVFAHAPSDLHMDQIETEMIKQVLGPHAYRIPVTSIKGCTGNPLGTGGVLQLIAACLSIRHERVPPTANYEHPDLLCDLDYPATARTTLVRHAVVNTHGFGRGNSSLVACRLP